MNKRVLALCFAALQTCAAQSSFGEQFESIKKSATREQLYTLLWDLPKGGDIHNHFSLSNLASQWYQAAIDPKRSNGNEFFTRVRFNNCPDSTEPLLRFRNIQRATFQHLSDCRKAEYVSLAALTPELKAEWLSSLKLDKPGEGRNEFFEAIVPRVGELSRDPWLAADIMVENMKRYAAQGLRYLETQTLVSTAQDHDGNPMDPERSVQILRDALNSPDAKATGLTVRFQQVVIRYLPNAEEMLERAYQFVEAHRDLWVGINMAGREDNDKGTPLRFLDTFRKMRRTYSNVPLSIHGGEVDRPGDEVRRTLTLGATRIGHGVNLITDPSTMLLMQNRRYLVEVSLISNKLLEYTPDLARHPFPEYLRMGIPVCLNTDDAGAWDSNITDEYFTAVTNFNLSWSEIVAIGRDSLFYSFAEAPVKKRMLKDYDEAVAAFERRYSTPNWQAHLTNVKPVPSGYAAHNLSLKGGQTGSN
ncbi:MAG: adenosine deaminase [Bryobacteraceae bacterium]